jgi:uncharacterized membrane protein (Fun14 family)
MSEQAEQPRSHPKSFKNHVVSMPRWHKSLLSVAILALGIGAAGQVVTSLKPKPSPPVTLEKHDTGERSHFVDQSQTSQNAQPIEQTQPGWGERLSPWMTRVGLSFVVGFVLGWVFRAFLKMMSLLALAGIAIMAALSYFHVVNLDLSAAREQYASTMGWATDQAQILGRAILGHIPGSTSSIVAFYMGFRRR